ncbi:MAG: hypothetical protein WC405_09070 [Syntrophales bacterium]
MPPINIYKCSQCDIIFDEGWGGYRYVESDEGKRICCAHPGEDSQICAVLGIPHDEYYGNIFNQWDSFINPPKLAWWWSRKRKVHFEEQRAQMDEFKSLIQSRAGYNSFCVCHDCLAHIELDLGDAEESDKSWRKYYESLLRKDERLCPHCGSRNVRTVMEMIGHICPHCKKGEVIEVDTGSIA